MKNWLRRLGSGTIAALLAVSLSGRAAAEAADPPVPEDPPAFIEGEPEGKTGEEIAAAQEEEAEGAPEGEPEEAPEGEPEGAPEEETEEEPEGEPGEEPEEESGGERSEEIEDITEETAEEQTVPGIMAFAAGDSDPDEGSGPEEVSAAIHVGSTEVDLSGGTSGTGWRYEDGSLILVDYDGSA